MPNNDDQLQQQYQEILNKYASSLTPSTEEKITPPVEPEAPLLPPVENNPEVLMNLPSEPLQPVETPVVETPEVENIQETLPPIVIPKPVTNLIPSTADIPVTPSITSSESVLFNSSPVPPIYFPPEPQVKKSSNFFKYLFYFSLIAFIGVISAVIYNFINNQQSITPTTLTPTPTAAEIKYCEVGDKKYEVGQSFASEDGCNTCSCGSDLTIACTLMACGEPVTSTPSATPTKKVTGKVYKDIKYGYQFECPTTAKYLVEATSVNGNKIPFKQESCTSVDKSVVTVAVYDNTVVHNFGNIKTQISPDEKYIITLEGDNKDIISSFKFL